VVKKFTFDSLREGDLFLSKTGATLQYLRANMF